MLRNSETVLINYSIGAKNLRIKENGGITKNVLSTREGS